MKGSREMTLDEWVKQLPVEHTARRQLRELKGRKLQLELELLGYADILDNIYNHNEAARAAVVQHMGTTHRQIIVNLRASKGLVKNGKGL